MDVYAKLQIKPGQRVLVLASGADTPAVTGIDLVDSPEDADVVVAFVLKKADLAASPAVEAARQDKLAWIAYPKDRQLGTDLNRNTLAESLEAEGLQPVRQIAIDDVWSALRFRPA
jgi:phage-related baseplate assembly protein